MASSYSGGHLFLLSFFWPGLLVQDEIASEKVSKNCLFPFQILYKTEVSELEDFSLTPMAFWFFLDFLYPTVRMQPLRGQKCNSPIGAET